MPKMIVSIDGAVIKEVLLLKERTTLGRRPYNDVVIDNLAVSGEHAVLHMADGEVEIEDLGSTNGTYVNGQPARRQLLRHGDTVEIGKYTIRFVSETAADHADRPTASTPHPSPSRPEPLPPAPAPLNAVIRVLTGAAAGREMALVKVVTTIGKPGLAVASITRRHHSFVLAHVEGLQRPLLNGEPLGEAPVGLQSGDRLELAGTAMEFVLL